MMETIDLTIDETKIQVEPGTTLLQACRKAGIDIPTLCYHDNLSPAHACRACVVEVKGERALVSSCSRSCENGMTVETKNSRVQNSRQVVSELLVSDVREHLAPDLLALFHDTHGQKERFAWGDDRKSAAIKDDNALFIRDYSQCILCYRCVQACGEDAQNTFAIALSGRGFSAQINAGFDRTLPESDCVFCGNCVAVCPTGALMDRREWSLREVDHWLPEKPTHTTCSYCGVGCELELHVQDNQIVKVTSPQDNPITHGMLCVKGRYGYEYVQMEE